MRTPTSAPPIHSFLHRESHRSSISPKTHNGITHTSAGSLPRTESPVDHLGKRNQASTPRDNLDHRRNPRDEAVPYNPLKMNNNCVSSLVTPPTQISPTNQAERAIQSSIAGRQQIPAVTKDGRDGGDDERKGQIEADMKSMIRKMQEYKSKDPSLFSQIWENVKTGHTPVKPSLQVSSEPVTILSPILQRKPIARNTSTDAQISLDSLKTSLSAHARDNDTTSQTLLSPRSDHQPIKRRKMNYVQHNESMQSPFQPPNQAFISQSERASEPRNSGIVETGASQVSNNPSTNQNDPQNPIMGKTDGHQFAPSRNIPTLWPKGPQGSDIAVALRQYLLNAPENHGKEITVKKIELLMARDPSFPTLCDMLAEQNFVVNPPLCAQHILKSVRGLQQGNMAKLPNQGINHQASLASGRGINDGQFQSARPASVRPASTWNHQPNQALMGSHLPLMGERPPIPSSNYLPPNPKLPHNHRQPALVAPLIRAAPKSQPNVRDTIRRTSTKADMARKQNFSDIVDLTVASDDGDQELEAARAKARDEAEGLAGANREDSQLSQGEMAALSFGSNNPIHLANVVERLKQQDSFQRSSYNTQTVARDVLVATGKHPSMAPLNEHLTSLRARFRDVDYSSDLSTFKWDVVDPGGPDLNEADHEADLVQPPISDRNRNRLSSPGRGDLFEAGAIAAPILRCRRKRKSITRSTDTQVQTEMPPSENVQQTASCVVPNYDHSLQDLSTLDAGESGSWGIAINHVSDKTSIGPATPSSKRRGRPPGSRRKQIKEGHADATMTPSSPDQRTTPITPQGSNLRGQIIVTSPNIAILVPPPPANRDLYETQAPRDRPKKSIPSSRQQSVPKYEAFECRWKSCPSKLHNLETLKRHALKHANDFKPGPFPCLWGECSATAPPDGSLLDGTNFSSLHLWEQHMHGTHFSIVAKRLGDGPRVTPSSDTGDQYLSDGHGRQVTPVAIPQHGRPDPVSLTAGPKITKAYHVAHENETEEEKASALYQAQLDRRRALGPGMLKTGATFVNDKKRKLLEVGEIEDSRRRK